MFIFHILHVHHYFAEKVHPLMEKQNNGYIGILHGRENEMIHRPRGSTSLTSITPSLSFSMILMINMISGNQWQHAWKIEKMKCLRVILSLTHRRNTATQLLWDWIKKMIISQLAVWKRIWTTIVQFLQKFHLVGMKWHIVRVEK